MYVTPCHLEMAWSLEEFPGLKGPLWTGNIINLEIFLGKNLSK